MTVVGAICCYFYPATTYLYHSSLGRLATEHRPLVDHTLHAIDPPSQAWYNTEAPRDDGPSPSGKAPGFGPGIRGFESLRPSHIAHASTHLLEGCFYIKESQINQKRLCFICSQHVRKARDLAARILYHIRVE